jgi:hypothetical protein
MSKSARSQPHPATSPKTFGLPTASKARTAPCAPPAYRPQPTPKALQMKAVQPPPLVGGTKRLPAALPAYRPQAAPRVLQPKAAVPHSPPPKAKKASAAPEVYRPQKVPVVLRKRATASQGAQAARAERLPATPPPYRPNPTPRVLQPKASAKAPESRHHGAGKTPAVLSSEAQGIARLPPRPAAGASPSPVKRHVREVSPRTEACPARPCAAVPRTPVQAKMMSTALPARPAVNRRAVILPYVVRGVVQCMEEDDQPFCTPRKQYHTFKKYKKSGIQVDTFALGSLEEQWECRDRPSTIEELEYGIIEERDDFEQFLERAAEHRRAFEHMQEENERAQMNQSPYTTNTNYRQANQNPYATTTTTTYQQITPQVQITNTQQARTEKDIANALYRAVQDADERVDLELFKEHPYGEGEGHAKVGKRVQLVYRGTPLTDEIQMVLGAFKEKEVFAAMAAYKNGGDADAKVLIEPGFSTRSNGVAYTGEAKGGGFPDIVIYTGPRPTVNTTYKGNEEFQIQDIIDLKFPYPSGGSKSGSWRTGQRENYKKYGAPWGIEPRLMFP